MANRFPLVLDTTDNNKIKEIQSGDNLNLTDNSITGVQNITALGTINAADITVNGNRLVAQAFADLTDTPSTFAGASNYFVKVKADGTGLEYRPLSDLGNIEIDTITVDTGIVPSVNNVGYLGTEASKFNEIVSTTLKGNLLSYSEEIVFNATTGKISYAALQGAPTFLSEFTDDIGFLRTQDLDDQLAGLFDEGQQFVTDIQGSVFGDDSSVLVDGVNSIITGDVLNSQITTTNLITSTAQITTTTVSNINGPSTGNLTIDPGASGIIDIGTSAGTTAVNIENAVIETFNQGSGLGVAQLTANTDLEINAGNRVKITGGVPFRFSSTTTALQLAIGAQEGDVIYNTTTSRLQMYQGSAWKDVNGNVEATAGTSNFNDVVIAGDLTVNGTLIGSAQGNHTGTLAGDVVGSVFADDSTLLVDGVNSSINLNGTVKGDIIPDTDVAYDLGSDTNRFRDLYLSGSTINLGGSVISTNLNGQLTLPVGTSIPGLSLEKWIPDSIVDGRSGGIYYNDVSEPVPAGSIVIDQVTYLNATGSQDTNHIPTVYTATIDGSGRITDIAIGTAKHFEYLDGADESFTLAGIATDNMVAIDPGIDITDPVAIAASSQFVILAAGVASVPDTVLAPQTNIPGYLSIAQLKVIVAASTDFADFQSRIAAV